MPVSISSNQQQANQPILQKFGMGAAMGGAVGLTLGFIFGGYSIITRGAGPRGPLNTLATYMISSGGTFAFFMSIGSVIRTESRSNYSDLDLELSRLNWQRRPRQILLEKTSSPSSQNH
ncbi:reactive mitochondrial oxygen species modulator 1-domain-containing protein [Phakopsora pachyrhizi]|uniref:Reactive mitochondrial oxygen species modulator 1-domain-containing protein n=1 Tax=Phakopsora pachyrhizi TaxID=170000 RepID=A0AAV0AG05_PHAPC|nr:reactive mitochondrial oxygen species modulator 1-domain-containing protein [Phakopsora pachyrhizi]CAH7666425.1 reactive mitochondrial oxygen species modulator 1-domain-containing protein [Phakopsora pachyrhizi]